LGDSIFDNARYVPGEPPVVQQLQAVLPTGWRATLLAVDGDCAVHVQDQQRRLPTDASHLVVSVGGNDALSNSDILAAPARTASDAIARLSRAYDEFRNHYQAMLQALQAHRKPIALCTIYDAIPGLDQNSRTGLMGFNDAILREAFAAGLAVIDLRLTCDAPGDFSKVSPIEPSAAGGDKIARAIARLVRDHDFTRGLTTIYR
jgi:lysophospholipase L1-like esterase